MDMDNELEEYLNSQDAAVAAAFSLPAMNNSGASSLQQRQLMNGELEAMVAENARELRRQSIASAYGNAVGPDYLDMGSTGDSSAYNSMVSPTSIVSADTFTMSPTVSQMAMTADMSSALMEAGSAAGDTVTQPMNMFSPMHSVSNSSMLMNSSTSMAMSPIIQTSMQQALQNQAAAFMQGRFSLFPYTKDGGITDCQVGMIPEYDAQGVDTVSKPPPHSQPRFVEGMYSSSGFDMIEILVSTITIRVLFSNILG